MTTVTLLFALIALPANTEAAGAQPGRPRLAVSFI